VAWVVIPTRITNPATGVDLTDHALAHQRGIGRLLDDADKFVPDCPQKAGVAPSNFEISVADPRDDHADKRLVFKLRLFNLADGDTLLFHS
jgi:hypothetical protein